MIRRFYKRESRCFCACELCRLRFNRMLYNRVFSGDPLNSYHPSGTLNRRPPYRRWGPYDLRLRRHQ
jgi:hypothetical protein